MLPFCPNTLVYHGQVIALMLCAHPHTFANVVNLYLPPLNAVRELAIYPVTSMPQALNSIQKAVAMCLNGKSTATAVLAGTTP
jgi:hypothetical protein